MTTDNHTPARTALVVDDEPDIRNLLRITLEAQGFTVVEVADGHEALRLAPEVKPDLITLDLTMPGIDGVETCRRLREFTDAYIMMITALGDEVDMLLGLEAGADEYLVKPFSVREVKARTAVLFRRPRPLHDAASQTPAAAPTTSAATDQPAHTTGPDRSRYLSHGPLHLDVDGRRVFKDADELHLTRTEFDLLALLMVDPSKVCTRENLLAEVWGGDWVADLRLVEVHIGNLRRKLTPAGENPLIDTVRGVGYRMSTPVPAFS